MREKRVLRWEVSHLWSNSGVQGAFVTAAITVFLFYYSQTRIHLFHAFVLWACSTSLLFVLRQLPEAVLRGSRKEKARRALLYYSVFTLVFTAATLAAAVSIMVIAPGAALRAVIKESPNPLKWRSFLSVEKVPIFWYNTSVKLVAKT